MPSLKGRFSFTATRPSAVNVTLPLPVRFLSPARQLLYERFQSRFVLLLQFAQVRHPHRLARITYGPTICCAIDVMVGPKSSAQMLPKKPLGPKATVHCWMRTAGSA